MDWLILRHVLNRAWNIMDATNKGVDGWVNDALRHRWLSCMHSGPDRWPQKPLPYHEESRHQMEQFWITCHLIKAPQWPHRVCDGLAWLDRVGKKLSVKANLLICSNCVTVSGQCLSVAIITSNKMDFNSCVYVYVWFSQIQSHMWPDFGKPFQIVHLWISRNTDLKYKVYYRLLMLDSSHIRFATEIE